MLSSPAAGLGSIFSGKATGLFHAGDALNFKTWHHTQFYACERTKWLLSFTLIQTFSTWRWPSCHKTQKGEPRRHGWVHAVEAGRAGTGWESCWELLEPPAEQKAWSRDQAAGVQTWAMRDGRCHVWQERDVAAVVLCTSVTVWCSALWEEKGALHLQDSIS